MYNRESLIGALDSLSEVWIKRFCCSFSNLGNTCYMNAILQSLLGLPPFVQDLSNKTLLENVHPDCLYR